MQALNYVAITMTHAGTKLCDFFKALYYLENVSTFENWDGTRAGLRQCHVGHAHKGYERPVAEVKQAGKGSGCPSSGLVARRTVDRQGHIDRISSPVSLVFRRQGVHVALVGLLLILTPKQYFYLTITC